MCNLSMKELNIVVNVVIIKELQKASFENMWSLSVTAINQLQKNGHDEVKYSYD